MKISRITTKFIALSIYVIVLFCGLGTIILNEKIDFVRTILQLLIPLIISIFILVDQRKDLKKIKKYKVDLIIIFANIIWFAITIFLGINIGIQSIKGLLNFSNMLIVLFFMYSIDFSKSQQFSIKKAFLVSCLICSIYGIIQYFFKIDLNVFENAKYPGIFGRINSTFYIATLLDKYMVLMFAFSCYNMLKNDLKIYNVLFMLTGLNVILTFSRGGFIAFLFILSIFIIKIIIQKKYLKLYLPIALISISLIIPGVNYLFQNTTSYVYDKFNIPEYLRINFVSTQMNSDINKDDDTEPDESNNSSNILIDSSLEFRNYYNSIGKQLFKEHLISGIGLNNYSFLYNNQNVDSYLKNKTVLNPDIHYMYPHNGFIQLGSEIGIVGLLLFFTYFVYICFSILKDSNSNLKYLSLVLLIAFLLGNYTESLMFNKQYIYIFILLFGFCSNASVCKHETHNTKSKKKISFLLLHLGRGGIESATINTANSLCDKYDVTLISLYKKEIENIETIDDRINIVHLLNYTSNRDKLLFYLNKKNYFKLFYEAINSLKILYYKKELIKEYIINSNDNILISTRMEFSILLSKYGNQHILKIACEHQHHNSNSRYISNIKHKYNNLDYLVALTKSLAGDYKQFLIKNKKTKIVTIPNMIPDESVKITDLNNNRIVSIGRLHPGKCIDEAIDIYEKSNVPYTFDIAGDGEEYERLKEYVSEKKLDKKVSFVGSLNRNGVNQLLSKSDIFIMTSKSEGLPMVLIEAMRCGVICIAYETESGVNDIIEDGVNGFIIKNRNETAFAEKLQFMVNNKKTLLKMQKNAIKTSKKFSSKAVLKQWITILEEK